MRKLAIYSLSIIVAGTLLTSCGLFRGGKSEKCPAYSQVSSGTSQDVATPSAH